MSVLNWSRDSVPIYLNSPTFQEIPIDPTYRVILDRNARIISCSDALAFIFNTPDGVSRKNLLAFIRPEHQQRLLDIPFDINLYYQPWAHIRPAIPTESHRSSSEHAVHVDVVDLLYKWFPYTAYICNIRVVYPNGGEQMLTDIVLRPNVFY